MSEEIAKKDIIESMTELDPKISRFINLYLTGQYTQQKLSQLLDVHINTVKGWLRRKDVKDIIHDLQVEQQESIGVQLKALTNKAVQSMYELLDSPIDGVKLQAAKDILDRGGHKPKQEVKKEVTVTTYEKKINDLINSAIECEYSVEDE